MSGLEPEIRRLCAEALDPFVGADRIDFVRDLGAQIPMRVISKLLGIPEADHETVRDRADAHVRTEPGKPRDYAVQTVTGEEFADYIDWRVDHPSDDMGAELGATTSMFPLDEKMATYLKASGRGDLAPIAERYPHLLAPDKEVEANPEKYYERVVKLDLSTLEPYVVGPHSPDRARPIGKLAAEVADPKNAFLDKISSTLIGSCTNSSYEDM